MAKRENYTGVGEPGVDVASAYYSIVALSGRQVMGAYIIANLSEGQRSI